MDFEEEEIKEFIEIYRKEYGRELTPAEAQREATKLFTLFKLVYLGTE